MAKGVSVGVEITGSAKGFKAAAEDAAKATAALNREARAKAREIEQSFKQVTMAMAKIAGAVIVAKKAFEVISSTMKVTEGGSDRLEEAIGGVKEGFFEVQRSVASLDFKNFFKNVSEGVERGKELTKALDDLVDQSAYNDYVLQGLKFEKAAALEIVKNKELELSVRADAAAKVKDIAEKIQIREVTLAEKSFNIQKRGWEGRNKMATEEAIKMYETVDSLSTATEDRLARAFESQTALFGDKKGIQMILSGEAMRGALKGIPEDVIQTYGKYFELLKLGEAEVLPKLFKTHKDYLFTITSAQEEYNSVLKQTSTLLEKEGNLVANLPTIPGMLQGRGNLPSFGRTVNPGLAIPKQFERDMAATAERQEIDKTNASLKRQEFIIESLSRGFDELFSGGKDGFKNMIDSMITDFRRLVTEILIKKAVMAIFNVVSSGAAGAASASAGASSGLSSTGGVIMSNQPVQFEAKVDNKYIYLSGKYYANKLGNTT